MKMKLRLFLPVILLALCFLTGCIAGSEDETCGDGMEGCACAPGGMCVAGLVCQEAVCVALSDAGVPENECAFGLDVYHNYFLDRSYTQEQVDAKIDAMWNHFFAGDPDTQKVYFESGANENGPYGYILDVANGDVRSEGMSYGMMFAVQMDHKEVFDALWNWAKTFMWHGDPTHPFYEYFGWSIDTDGTPRSEGPAPDGEEYFVMALYFASGRWGDGEGIFNYRAEADRVLTAMKNREPITGTYLEQWGGVQEGTGTAMFNPTYKMVRFSPNEGYFLTDNGDHTDPSYHVPAFYELWARFGPEADRPFWLEAARASRDFFQAAADDVTALTPDYARFDGSPLATTWDPNTAAFRSDAHRTVMNWSVDWAWWCVDERERALSDKLQSFFVSQGSGYPALYHLDGTPLAEDNYGSTGLRAINATSVLAATDPERSAWFIDTLWNLDMPTGEYRYYDGMLYMFAVLHVGGRFQIYRPE